jgi:hypothetical protein
VEEGTELKIRLNAGGSITVTLEDRVYPDRSCGQVEAGWWVYAPTGDTAAEPGDYPFEDFFLSESGILYDYGGSNFDRPVGIHPGLAKRVKQMNAEVENAQAEN